MKTLGRCIAFPSPPQPHGGPGSFQTRFENALKERGWIITYSQQSPPQSIDVVMVIAGTRHLGWLLGKKIQGVPIVQRLDGVLWQHRFEDKGLWRSRIKPLILQSIVSFIYRFFADSVVYQSDFIRRCWRNHSKYRPPFQKVIHNAVDLKQFSPAKNILSDRPNHLPKLLCVEGEVQDSDANLQPLIDVGSKLIAQNLISGVTIIGDISSETRARLERFIPTIDIKGRQTRDETQAQYPGSIFLPLEINAPCPNSVIEAMASGCPIVGFDSGSLAELVPPDAGQIVPYDGNPWQLEVPDSNLLLDGITKVLENYPIYSANARKVAVQNYDLDKMILAYINCIENVLRKAKS